MTETKKRRYRCTRCGRTVQATKLPKGWKSKGRVYYCGCGKSPGAYWANAVR